MVGRSIIGRVLARIFGTRWGSDLAGRATAAAARYPKQLEQALSQTPQQLKKSVTSFTGSIARHQEVLKNPQLKVANWNQLTPTHQRSLIHHWNNDISRVLAYRDIAEGVLKGILK
jgi:hypothetical protein